MTAAPADKTLRRLVLGVLLPGFSGTKAPEWLLEAAREGLAGVVLFAQNTPDIPTTRHLTDELHDQGPLLVMIDEEGGDVSRMQAVHGSALPGAAALGAVDDVALTRKAGGAIGGMLSAAGIDVDLAPVLDVSSEPTNPVIGVRSFGADSAQVAHHGSAFIAGLHDVGIAACAKHFPGHGATKTDSHLELPLLDVSKELLLERDVAPFAAVAHHSLDALMTGHLHIPAVGPKPGTLEPAVTRLARDLAGGRDRPIITDALDMAAVAGTDQETFGEACVQALEAGADLLCLGTTADRDDKALFARALDAVTNAVEQGRITRESLQQAHERTEHLRSRIQKYRNGEHSPSSEAAEENARSVGEEIARRAVRVEHGDVARSGPFILVDLRRRVNHAAGRVSSAFARALERKVGEARVLTPGVPDSEPIAESLHNTDGYDIIALTREPLADESEQHDLDAVLNARPDTVVVHGGTEPAAPTANNVILAHGVGRANAEAVLNLILAD